MAIKRFAAVMIGAIASGLGLLVLAAVVSPDRNWIRVRTEAAVAKAPEDKQPYARKMIGQGLTCLRGVSAANGIVLLLGAVVLLRTRRRGDHGEPPEVPGPARTGAMFESRRDLPIVLPLLAVAAVLRSTRLDAGLWYDEIFTYQHFVTLPLWAAASTYFVPNNHILFTLVSKGALNLAGSPSDPDSIAACLRVVPTVSGVLLVLAVYQLAVTFLPRPGAWLAGLAAAVAPILVDLSQQARGHILAALLATYSTVLLLSAARRRGTGRWIGYVICSVLMIYTVPTCVLVLIGHGAAVMIAALARSPGSMRPGTRHRWAIAAAASLLATAQLYAFVLPQAWAYVRQAPLTHSTPTPIQRHVGNLLDQIAFDTGRTGLAMAFWGAILAAAVWQMRRPQARLAVAACLVTVLCAAGASAALSGGAAPRFFLFAAGPAGVLIGMLGATVLEPLERRPRAGLTGVAILSAGMAAACWPALRRQWAVPLQPIRQAVREVGRQVEPDGRVCAAGMAARQCRFYEPVPGMLLIARDPEQLKQIIRRSRAEGAGRLWVILTYPTQWKRRLAAGESPWPPGQTVMQATVLPGRVPDGDIHIYLLPLNRMSGTFSRMRLKPTGAAEATNLIQ